MLLCCVVNSFEPERSATIVETSDKLCFPFNMEMNTDTMELPQVKH